MKRSIIRHTAAIAAVLTFAFNTIAQTPDRVTPMTPDVVKEYEQTLPSADFVRREAMVPMRDGVKLFTLILTPKERTAPLPLLLERTPYDASRALSTSSTRLLVTRGVRAVGGGFIYVVQDIRGRFKSGGEFHMYRVPRGAFTSDPVMSSMKVSVAFESVISER